MYVEFFHHLPLFIVNCTLLIVNSSQQFLQLLLRLRFRLHRCLEVGNGLLEVNLLFRFEGIDITRNVEVEVEFVLSGCTLFFYLYLLSDFSNGAFSMNPLNCKDTNFFNVLMSKYANVPIDF